jgi:hypothetical protein
VLGRLHVGGGVLLVAERDDPPGGAHGGHDQQGHGGHAAGPAGVADGDDLVGQQVRRDGEDAAHPLRGGLRIDG